MKQKNKLIISLTMLFLLIAQLFSTPSIIQAHWLYGDIENGILVKQKNNVTPETKIIYYPQNATTDPWKGGYADFVWKDTVAPTLTAIGGSDALQAAKNGLNFAARINLPDEITAKDVIESLDYSNSYLYVGTAEPYKLDAGFFSYDNPDDNYLYFTMRKGAEFNKLVQWLIDIIKSIITNFSGSLDVKLVAKIDVNKLTKNGYPEIDKSPNQLLTKGMAPPSPDKILDFGVNFYGHNQISWKGIEPTPLPGQESANPSTDEFPTWNTYLSPWDNKNTFNSGGSNTTDNWEQVTKNGVSQNTFLPGPFNKREISFKSWDQSNINNVGNRFDRVVNIFTKEDVTDNSKITHDIDDLTASNTTKKSVITYEGLDESGTLLSPRQMSITRDDASLTAALGSAAKPIYYLNETLSAPIDFTQLDTRSKKLDVTISDSLSSITTKTSINVQNSGKLEKATVSLPSDYSTVGKHHTTLTITDEYNRTVKVPYDYTVLDLPTFNGHKTLNNGVSSSNETLLINPGENVSINTDFTPNIQLPMKNAVLRAHLPQSTSLISNSTKLSVGTKTIDISDSNWIDGKLAYQLSAIPAGSKIKLDYKVSTSKNDVGKTLLTEKDTIESTSMIDDQTYLLGETNSVNIFVKNGELKFGQITENTSFGLHDIPDKVTTYHRETPDKFSIKVFDSYQDDQFNWTLSSKMLGNLVSDSGITLDANLLLIQDSNLKNQYPGLFDGELTLVPNHSQVIYTNNLANNGILNFDWPVKTGLAIKVPNNQNFNNSANYSGTIQWSLDAGPSN